MVTTLGEVAVQDSCQVACTLILTSTAQDLQGSSHACASTLGIDLTCGHFVAHRTLTKLCCPETVHWYGAQVTV